MIVKAWNIGLDFIPYLFSHAIVTRQLDQVLCVVVFPGLVTGVLLSFIRSSIVFCSSISKLNGHMFRILWTQFVQTSKAPAHTNYMLVSRDVVAAGIVPSVFAIMWNICRTTLYRSYDALELFSQQFATQKDFFLKPAIWARIYFQNIFFFRKILFVPPNVGTKSFRPPIFGTTVGVLGKFETSGVTSPFFNNQKKTLYAYVRISPTKNQTAEFSENKISYMY